jgi:hypothetical protein
MKAFPFSQKKNMLPIKGVPRAQSSPAEIGAHFEQFIISRDDAKKNVNLYLSLLFALAAES